MSTESTSERLIKTALELCRIPSVSGDERKAADYVEQRLLKSYNRASITRERHDIVLRTPCPPGRPVIALFGHLDTVPPASTDVEPHLDGDRIVGCGSSDMKAGIAVMLLLAETLTKAHASCEIRYFFYDSEEGDYSANGLGLLMDKHPAFFRGIDLALVLEPTDGIVHVACNGSLHAILTFPGARAHSSRPWEGRNAIQAAGEMLCELEKRPRNEVVIDGLSFYEVMSATMVSGGTARNVIPDRMELCLNYRFSPLRTADNAKQEVLAFVRNRAEVKFADVSPAGRVCTCNPHLKRLIGTHGLKTGAKQGWTDVARLGLMGIDAANYGPGLTAQAHQAGEYASVKQLESCFNVLTAFLSVT